MIYLISFALALTPPSSAFFSTPDELTCQQEADKVKEEDSFDPVWIDSHRAPDGSFVMGYYLPKVNWADDFKTIKREDVFFYYHIIIKQDNLLTEDSVVGEGYNFYKYSNGQIQSDDMNPCSSRIDCSAKMATWNATEKMINFLSEYSDDERDKILQDLFSEKNCSIKIFPTEAGLRIRDTGYNSNDHYIFMFEETCTLHSPYKPYIVKAVFAFPSLIVLFCFGYPVLYKYRDAW
jgi:hypothetical protein